MAKLKNNQERVCASAPVEVRPFAHVLSALVVLACALALAWFPATGFQGSAYAEEAGQVELATTSDGQDAAPAASGSDSDGSDAVTPDADGAVVVEGSVVEEEATQISDDDVPLSSGVDDAAEGETIEDEDNPLSSGLEDQVGGAGVPLYGLIAVMIAGVVAFFATSTRRVNANISAMNRKIR